MSRSLEILSVPPSWYLLSSSSLYLLTHPSCGLSIPLLDSCSIFLISCSLKVLPAMSLLNAQNDLPKMKHCYVCLAGTEVCDEDTFPCLWPFMLNTAMFPLSSSLMHCLLPLSCAIVYQPPTLGLPLTSGGCSCPEKVWLLPKPVLSPDG